MPLREVCLVAIHRVEEQQLTHYLLQCLLYAQGGTKEKPSEPPVLKGTRWPL